MTATTQARCAALLVTPAETPDPYTMMLSTPEGQRTHGWWGRWLAEVGQWGSLTAGLSGVGQYDLLDLIAPEVLVDSSPDGFPWQQTSLDTAATWLRVWGRVFAAAERLGYLIEPDPDPWLSQSLPIAFGEPDPMVVAVSELEAADEYAAFGMDDPTDTLLIEVRDHLLATFPAAYEPSIPLVRLFDEVAFNDDYADDDNMMGLCPTVPFGVVLTAAADWMDEFASTRTGWVLRPGDLATTGGTDSSVSWVIAPEWSVVEDSVTDAVAAEHEDPRVRAAAVALARWSAVAVVLRQKRHLSLHARLSTPEVLDWVLAPTVGAVDRETRTKMRARCRADYESAKAWDGETFAPISAFTSEVVGWLRDAGSLAVAETRFPRFVSEVVEGWRRATS